MEATDNLALFQRSFRTVLDSGFARRSFVDRFYENFMSKSETIAERFKSTDMQRQKTMLHDSLHYMINYMSSPKARKAMVNVAEIHSRAQRDIPPELYDVWLESLIETVRQCDPDFDEDTELGWRVAMAPGITYMKHMYARR